MTQRKIKKHIDEMKRWAESPKGTKVWLRCSKNDSWKLSDDPQFWSDCIYIIDDEWADLRKAQADGKQLQVFVDDPKAHWVDETLTFKYMEHTYPKHWRIKPKNKFPVYRRHKENGFIVRFSSESIYEVVMSSDKDYPISSRTFTGVNFDRDDTWEQVDTVKIDGITYYDTQPVWAWDNGKCEKTAVFFDAKNECAFWDDGSRDGLPYEHFCL